ncbi:MAG: 2-amino-4-hydroxy-6-hydroxymethyldihydropteridine diphosphokinase [Wolinella sp.]
MALSCAILHTNGFPASSLMCQKTSTKRLARGGCGVVRTNPYPRAALFELNSSLKTTCKVLYRTKEAINSNSFDLNKSAFARRLSNEIVVGIGGNLGNVSRTFSRLLRTFKRGGRVDIISTSPLYLNPAFGFLEQSPFLNATIRLGFNGGYCDFFAYTSYLERRFGRARRREFKNAPRTLDIDIIFFKGMKIATPSMKIPHPHWNKRESVLIPLILDS